MHAMEELKELLDEQVEKVVKKGDINATEMDNIYKAVKTKYYIDTIEAMKEYSNDGYSGRRGYSRENYGEYDGGSYRRGGGGGYSRYDEREAMMNRLGRM